MKRNQRSSNVGSLLALLAAAIGASTPLSARAGVDAHGFHPSLNTGYTLSEDALTRQVWGSRGSQRLTLGAFYDFVNDPLVILNRNSERVSTVVDSIQTLNLGVAYNPWERFQIGASGAVASVKRPNLSSEWAAGDSRLYGKLGVLSANAPVALAVMPEIFLPTGNRSLYLSDGGTAFGLRAIAEKDLGFLSLAANAGWKYSPKARVGELNQRSVLPLSLGALIPVGSSQRWAINTEGAMDVALPFNNKNRPSSLYAGARYRPLEDLVLSAGGAVGAFNRDASTDYRIIAGLTYSPSFARKAEPIVQNLVPAPVAAAPAAPAPLAVLKKDKVEVLKEVLFEEGEATLTSQGRIVLNDVATILRGNADQIRNVIVEGHTNHNGSIERNQKLSERRAEAVRAYLVAQGVPYTMLATKGFGQSKPKVGINQPQALSANRRVEFKLVRDEALREANQ